MPTRPVPFDVSLVQVGNSLRVTIPKEVVKMLGLKKGDLLRLTVEDTSVVIRKG